MKKKIMSLLMAVAMTVLLAGCSSSDSESQKVSESQEEQEDPQALLEEARNNLEKEELKSMELSTVTTYDNGIQEEEDSTYIYDAKKQIIESLSQDDAGVETYLHDFHVKDGNDYKVYTLDEYGDGDWVVYKEELEDDEQSEYESLQEEFSLDIDEEHGFHDIRYSNEGEDVIYDVDAIKLKMTATEEYDTGEVDLEEVSRQSVMEDYGWTEEEVSVVDGFSSVLDNYAAASNRQDGVQEIQTTVTVWIGADNHQILRVRQEQDVESGQDEGAKELIETFQNERWKMDLIHSLVSEKGKSLQEAKEKLEEEIRKMENPQDAVTEEEPEEEDTQGSSESSSGEGSYYSAVLKIVTTKRFRTAERCPQMGELPENAREVSSDEYYEGNMENYQKYYEEQDPGEDYGEDQIEGYDDLGDVME